MSKDFQTEFKTHQWICKSRPGVEIQCRKKQDEVTGSVDYRQENIPRGKT